MRLKHIIIFILIILLFGCDKTPVSPDKEKEQNRIVKQHDQGGIN